MVPKRPAVERSDLLRFVPHLVLLCSALLGLAWWETRLAQHERVVQTQLEFTADHMTEQLVDHIEALNQILRGASGFLATGPAARKEWSAYVDELKLAQNSRGVQGLGFSRRLAPDELQAHQSAIRAEGFPDFVVFPTGDRAEYSSIDYIEPFTGRNLRAFGFDMLSDPTRRTAMEAARDSGEIVASSRVRLLQETETDLQPGLLLYHPVYRPGALCQTVEQRRAALVGWVYMPLRLNDAMDSIFGHELDTVRLEILDAEGQTLQSVFDSGPPAAARGGAPEAAPAVRTVGLNGRTWLLKYHRLPGYVTAAGLEPNVMTPALLVVGLFLLAGLSWSLVHTRRRATALAARLTESLAASEAKYKGTFEQAGIGISHISLSRTVLAVNERYAAILGYSRQEMLGRSLEDFIVEEDRALDRALLGELVAERRSSYSVEKRYRRKDGAVVVGLSTAALQRDAQGHPAYFISALEDITARVEAEDRFRLVAEQAHTGVVVVQEGRVVFANEAAAAVTGLTQEEWEQGPGARLDERVVPAEGSARSEGEWLAACVRPDGSTSMLMRHDRATTHLGRPAVLSTLVDVTGLRRAQQALEAKSQHFETLLKTSMDAIHVLSVDGRLLEWNDAFLKHLGYDEDEATQLHIWDWNEMPRDELLAALKAVPPTGARIDSRHVRKDRTVRDVEVSVVPVRGAHGEAQLLAAARDVTDRKRNEQEQSRMHRLEALGTMAGGIAHDFNNILTGAYGHLELVAGELEPGSQARGDLETAKQSLMRAKELTQRLITFARGGAPVKAALALLPLLRDVAQAALGKSQIHLELSVEDDLPRVEADESQLHQVLNHLLLNASQAMGDRGHIVLRAARRRALPNQARHLPPGEYVEVTVQDDGPGIASGDLEKIFDPFFSTREFGRGLGLPASFSIVKRHGGHLWAESLQGHGASLHLLLPVAAGPAVALAPVLAPRPSAAPAPQRSQFSIHVLVMDDEPIVRLAGQRLLKGLGAVVETAEDGDQALRLVKEAADAGQPYDVALLDLTVVGGRGGAEIVEELRQASPTTHPLVSSGYGDDPVMAEPGAHGFDGVLPKPYSLVELAEALRAALRGGSSPKVRAS